MFSAGGGGGRRGGLLCTCLTSLVAFAYLPLSGSLLEQMSTSTTAHGVLHLCLLLSQSAIPNAGGVGEPGVLASLRGKAVLAKSA